MVDEQTLTEIATSHRISPDLVVDLFRRASNQSKPFSATGLATSTRTMLIRKGYRVTGHVSTVRAVLDALTDGGVLVRNGANRYRLATSPAPTKVRPRYSRRCGCSATCTSQTRGRFAPGHDARLVSRLVKQVVATELTVDQAAQQVADAGGSSALVDKLRRALAKAAPAPVADRPTSRKVRAEVAGRVRDGFIANDHDGKLVFHYRIQSGALRTTKRYKTL